MAAGSRDVVPLEGRLLAVERALRLQAEPTVPTVTLALFVCNTATQVVHRSHTGSEATVCGWKFIGSRARLGGRIVVGPAYKFVLAVEDDWSWSLLCEKCLPVERELARRRHAGEQQSASE